MKAILILLLLAIFTSTACAADVDPHSSPAASGPTLTPFGPGRFEAASQDGTGTTPENIVQAFLTDVQEAPDQIQGYMSSVLKDRYPGSTIIDAIQIDGMIEGFAIRSATSNDMMGLAYVTAGISTQNSNLEVQFTLIKENGFWVISAFEIQSPG